MPQLDWFDRVPKVEIHVHLEGSIPHDALWTLVQQYGGPQAVPTLAALVERFTYRDFPHFIATWGWKNSFLRTYADFTFVAEAVARDLARQQIRYAEVFYSPPDFTAQGLQTQPLTEAIRAGLDRVPAIEIALVADLVRDYGPTQGAVTLAEVCEVQHLGVVGITIGGSEHKVPPEVFAPVFATARRKGLRTSAHAGEAAGAASVWGAVRALQVDRIGHGTRALEDPALVAELVARQIPVELCPLSNLRTGVISRIEDHPARHFFDQGMLLSVNTDDPQMFNNSLAEEYRLLETQLNFRRDEIRQLMLQSVTSAWLSDERKRQLALALQADPGWGDGVTR